MQPSDDTVIDSKIADALANAADLGLCQCTDCHEWVPDFKGVTDGEGWWHCDKCWIIYVSNKYFGGGA